MARIPVVLVLFSLLFPAVVLADTVYFKNGDNLWCKYTREEADHIVLVRPSGDVSPRRGSAGSSPFATGSLRITRPGCPEGPRL